MASDIEPQFPSTPDCLCLWAKLNHLSSRSLQVLAGFTEDCRPGLHRSTVTRGYRTTASSATLIRKNFQNCSREVCSQIKAARRGCGKKTAVDWSATCR